METNNNGAPSSQNVLNQLAAQRNSALDECVVLKAMVIEREAQIEALKQIIEQTTHAQDALPSHSA